MRGLVGIRLFSVNSETHHTSRISDLNIIDTIMSCSRPHIWSGYSEKLAKKHKTVKSFSELNKIFGLSVFCATFYKLPRMFYITPFILSLLSLLIWLDFINSNKNIFSKLSEILPSLPGLCSKPIAQLIIRLPMRLPAPSAAQSLQFCLHLQCFCLKFLQFLFPFYLGQFQG